MKVRRTNPDHLVALAASASFSLLAALFRPIIKRKKRDKIIIFYGHTLNGNLKAFFDYLIKQEYFHPYFLALEKKYYKNLKKKAEDPTTILSALSVKDMLLVARADVFITSHGLHLFTILKKLSNIKYVDVWHAVSYKGFSAYNFRRHHSYDEIWITSKFIRNIYVNKFLFEPEKLKITGYGRTDQLVDGSLNKESIIAKHSIPRAAKYILIAPTWKQDDQGRSVLPFGIEEKEFFTGLDKIAVKYNAHIIFRTHLNSDDEIDVSNLKCTSFMPYGKYEVVEEFLFISDVLITDWSSIGIDFLPLKRPAIFLDVPAPFRHGFELGPEHRYGDIAKNFQQLKTMLENNLEKPNEFIKKHEKQMAKTTEAAYGSTLDGKSTSRYFHRLKQLLSSED